ncbi:MAG: carbohydrate kinase family protein [Spirochaetia bacterium]|nr:carbohydrate kinase family protein [Spirochaetia bacterium]
MQTSIVIVGNASIDSVVTEQGVIHPRLLGGNAFHAGMSAATFSDSVKVVAVVPKNFPLHALASLKTRGVDLSALVRSEESVTVGELFIYNEKGDRKELLAYLGEGDDAPRPIDKAELAALVQNQPDGSLLSFPAFRQRNRVHGSDIPSPRQIRGMHLAPTALETHRECIALGAPIITLDPGSYLKTLSLDEVVELVNSVTVFLPSKKEMAWIFGDLSVLDALRVLARRSTSSIICKNGKEGCYVFSSEDSTIYELGTYPSNVADYTGAGDFFCGAVITQLAAGRSVLAAARIATVTAASAIERMSIPARANLDRSEILSKEQQVPWRKLEVVARE